MSFTPSAVVKSGDEYLLDLEWPRDKWAIAFLSQPQQEAWYASRKPLDLIYESEQFNQFWYSWYIKPLKFKRWFWRLFW